MVNRKCLLCRCRRWYQRDQSHAGGWAFAEHHCNDSAR
ncbi:hypothetical protein L838_1380 [Mycobacterium avium MAV_120709_2344]|nr:hypothetical protein L838_1380 [Mycobacterium avium MAV_120709_2344]